MGRRLAIADDEEEHVTKRFECNNVFAGCEGVVEAASDDEVLAAAAGHAASVHGVTTLPDTVVAQVRAGITEV